MADVKRSERTIFVEALDLPAGDERQAFLEEACGDDLQLRTRVESLLSAYDSPQEPLARFGFDEAERRPPLADPQEGLLETIGDRIGPYKLLEQIGEGGFGFVFMAQQEQPVRRKVALKILKPGMDTRRIIARFEAERQALALMDHPNIAKVLDAGTTETGRPYFVMELVQGVLITAYCDQCNLTTRERLKLFIKVCRAVQHAHQKGVIHRDLKPSNIMVTMHDAKAVPKIIDFGVAKAISQQLTEKTLFTAYGQMVGTPMYMSPEQAQLSGLDVDTRSDVYSLGVLLYELITGTTPFDEATLQRVDFDEMRRIIREDEPPRPSARISTLKGELLSTVADVRRIDPRKLSQSLRGEVDWIVMKCLEKDRNRRYETANGLARDIERYLGDEPVQACPPSAAYRFRKFARRNKAVLAVASAALAALLLMLAGLAISNRLIAAERNEKTAALARAEAERQRAEENFRRARIAVRGILSDAARGVGQWSELPLSLRERFAQETVNYYESLLQEGSDDPSLQYETAVGYRSLSAIYNSLGQRQQAEKVLRGSIAILEELASQYPKAVRYRHQLAYTQYMLGGRFDLEEELAEAEAAFQRSTDLYLALVADRPDHGSYYLELAACYRALIRLQDKRRESQDTCRTAGQLSDLLRTAASTSPSISDLEMVWRLELLPKVPPASPIAPDVPMGIAEALIGSGRVDEAVAVCRENVQTAPDDAAARYCLAYPLEVSGQFDEAIAQLQKAVDLEPDYVDAHNGLAWLLVTCPDDQFRDPQRAVAHASRVVELAPTHAAFWNVLGIAEYRAGDFDATKQALEKALELEGDDAFVLFFLAMADWQLGNQATAREAYEKGVEWMENQRPEDEVLRRFRDEATELIGIPES